MITKMDDMTSILLKKGIKPTYQRLRILKYLMDNLIHPNADTIYEAVSSDIPTISRTTVYNTLHTFVETGLIQELIITGSEARFDFNIDPHHHFLCESCGLIFDLWIECLYAKQGSIEGHKISNFHGYFKGICKECLDKMPKEDKSGEKS
jgi:Fur family peroxide stress response transcriptional regulator